MSWDRLVIHPDFKTTSFEVAMLSWELAALVDNAFWRDPPVLMRALAEDGFRPEDGVTADMGSFKAEAVEFFPMLGDFFDEIRNGQIISR